MNIAMIGLQYFADEAAAAPAEVADPGTAAEGPESFNVGDELADGTKVESAQVAAALNRQMKRHPELRKVYGQRQPAQPAQPAQQQQTQPSQPAQPAKPAETFYLKKISGKYYCISSLTGKKVKGFRTINGKVYYFNSKGVMVTGWQKIGKSKYYFAKNGVMQTGWKTIKGKKYYFDESGKMAKGWKMINGYKYYFSSSGVMQKGWKTIGKYKYYFAKSGIMQTGWVKISKKMYYFDDSGRMNKKTTLVINGKTYKFKKTGVCTNY